MNHESLAIKYSVFDEITLHHWTAKPDTVIDDSNNTRLSQKRKTFNESLTDVTDELNLVGVKKSLFIFEETSWVRVDQVSMDLGEEKNMCRLTKSPTEFIFNSTQTLENFSE